MGTLERHMRDVGEWMQEFSPVWACWAARLATLQPGDGELEGTRKDAQALLRLIGDAYEQPWEAPAHNVKLWEQAFG